MDTVGYLMSREDFLKIIILFQTKGKSIKSSNSMQELTYELNRCNKVKLLLQTKHGHINLQQFYNLQYI